MKYAARFYSNSGSPYKVSYSPKVSSSGSVRLVESGKINLYQEIQSHKDSVDLKSLIARFELGEVDVLNRQRGFFGDVTSMPTSYAEMHAMLVDARSHFDALPVDIRKKYNFDFGVFLNQLGELTPVSKSSVDPAAPVSKESEDKSNES